jgi:beta-glucosidase-like glycosyl hydrolase
MHSDLLRALQIMIPFRFEEFLEDLVSSVEAGEIPVSRIDDAVERILRVKFISGVFERPFSEPALLDTIGCKVERMSISLIVVLFELSHIGYHSPNHQI